MSNRQNKQDNKTRVNFTIDAGLREFYTENRVNMSNIANEALKGLKTVIEESENPENVSICLNLSKYAKIEWSRGDSDPRPPACKAVREFGSVSGIDPVSSGFENFSTLGEINENGLPNAMCGHEIRGLPGISIGEFMQDKKDIFLQFCVTARPPTTHKGTREGYYRALLEMKNVYIPTDIPKKITKTQDRALKKFLRMWTEELLNETGFNGYSDKLWRGVISRAENGTGERAGTKTKDLTSAEVAAAAEAIDDPAIRTFYTLAGFSGARAGHLWKWLNSKNKKLEMLSGCIRADVRDTSAGTKHEAYFYFPPELEKAILNFRCAYGLDFVEKTIGKLGTADRPINISSLRKYNVNVLLDVMDPTYADAVQGRAAKGVGAQHYYDLAGKAAQRYPVALPELKKGLPIPAWMKAGDVTSPKRRRT